MIYSEADLRSPWDIRVTSTTNGSSGNWSRLDTWHEAALNDRIIDWTWVACIWYHGPLSHWGRDTMASFLQTTFSCMKSVAFDSYFIAIFWIICLDNCMATNKLLAIIWTNDDLAYLLINASFGRDELSVWGGPTIMKRTVNDNTWTLSNTCCLMALTWYTCVT